MSNIELYTERTRIWLPDPELIWRGAKLVNNYKEGDESLSVFYETADGQDEANISVVKLPKSKVLPFLRNPEILVGENDLTSLSYLHEPAVLHNLQIRFVEKNAVYTYCGIVLVAINPYDELDIYSDDFIQLYSGRNLGEMDPHIFAIAEEAFNQMSRYNKNQSIIVSGESGAGKTVSAKFTMRYFATVGGTSKGESNAEQRVLASNPIMEAIGNAKTIRNDNSSRFGKYIELGFNKKSNIIGANMRTYLLEKSRVVSQAPNERNYHIFYQLCACSDMPQFQPLKLMSADKFEYTRNGDCMSIDGVDDKKEFVETVHSLTMLGVSSQYQSLIFRVLSAILHMGNIDIQASSKGNDSCTIKQDDYSLATMCELLGIERNQMLQWLCHKKITAMAEVVVTPLKLEQALQARDALAKHMYSKLFEWIVDKVNNALVTSSVQHSFIGVLDIYGFETFQVNSFEQFCINYANEKLQQQFCQHVFKLEQEEYIKEEIEWKFIDFQDNQPCIALIENKLGILDLLNDECRMPRGSDNSWAEKLYSRHLKTSEYFEKSKLSNTSFFVIHFADKVRYEIEGFLDKNRDSVNSEQLAILKASQYALVAELFVEPESNTSKDITAGIDRKGTKRVTVTSSTTAPSSGRAGRKKETKKTVASQFQESLGSLMKTLNSTTPHYVRCIKPNDFKLSFTFEPRRASQQLKACGVLETIRISAAGYPSRWNYNEFVTRYRVLMKSSESKGNPHQICSKVLARLIPDDSKYQAGKTKIFFRAGQVAFLEKLRAEKLRSCAVMIQRNLRCWLQRKRYLKILNAAKMIQRVYRGHQARSLVTNMRRNAAAVKIQAKWKMFIEKTKYDLIKTSIVTIQSFTRGYLARVRYRIILQNFKAIIIQKHIRGWLARRSFNKRLKSIVIIQCCIRRHIAKKELKKLKIEARSVDHFKKLNIGMENKIMELQRKLDASMAESASLMTKANQVDHLKDQLQDHLKDDQMIKELSSSVAQLEEEITRCKSDANDKESKMLIQIEDLMTKDAEKEDLISQLQDEVSELKRERSTFKEESATREDQIRNASKEEWMQEKMKMQEEIEEMQKQMSQQQKDQDLLQQRYDNLKDELEIARRDVIQRSSSDDEELQMEVNKLEEEKKNMESKMSSKEDQITSQMLLESQNECQGLKEEMKKLRQNLTLDEGKELSKDSAVFKELCEKVELMQKELDVYKEKEINRKLKQSSNDTRSTMTDAELLGSRNRMEDINVEKLEKSDLKTVLAKVYDHNRILEAELEAQRRDHETEVEDLRKKSNLNISSIKKTSNFDVAGDLDFHQVEMTRLNHENNQLQQQVEGCENTIKKLRRQLKLYSKKLNEGANQDALWGADEDLVPVAVTSHPVLRHKDSVTSLGMLQYKFGDEFHIVKHIIHEYPPPEDTELPGLQAYLLFKLLRYADYNNDERMIKSLLQQIISGIKTVEKKHENDFEYMSFWFANTNIFLHSMKQYSGDDEYANECSEEQSRHFLRNFDLSEYRPVLNDILMSLFHRLLQTFERELKPMIVPAMLETDTIQGISSTSKPTGMRGRSSSSVSEKDLDTQVTVETILKLFSHFHETLLRHGVDVNVLRHIFHQMLYFISSHALNNQMMRKELCNWPKAMQIRFNVTQIEDWLRQSYGLSDDKTLREQLEPLVHASHLLQLKKQNETDAEEICSMCTALNPLQIVKLLQMVTPTDDYEERVSMKFVRIVQNKLKETRKPVKGVKLLNDASARFASSFPFVLSPVDLSVVDIPPKLMKQMKNLVKSI